MKESKPILEYVSKDHKGIKSIIQKCSDKKTFSEKCRAIETSKVWKVGYKQILDHPESEFYLIDSEDGSTLAIRYPTYAHVSKNHIIVNCQHFSYILKELICPAVFPEHPVECWHLKSDRLAMKHIGVKVGKTNSMKNFIFGIPKFFQNIASLKTDHLVESFDEDLFSNVAVLNGEVPYEEIVDSSGCYLIFFNVSMNIPKPFFIPSDSKDQIAITVSVCARYKGKKPIEQYSSILIVDLQDFLKNFNYLRQSAFFLPLNNKLCSSILFGKMDYKENIVRSIPPLELPAKVKIIFMLTYEELLLRITRGDFIKMLSEL